MSGSDNKVAIVTGANSGIGLEVTKLLAGSGFTVVMACRSLERANEAINKIRNETTALRNTAGTFVPLHLDLGDYDSVRKFASEFRSKYSRLDVLINNAGYSEDYSNKTRRLNAKGHELTVATNHLGHFLLTSLLLQLLKDTASRHGVARVLIVSSDVHLYNDRVFGGKSLDFSDPFLEKPGAYTSAHAYKNSKTMNVLHSRKLARMLSGTGVFVNAIHPGFIPTTGFFHGFMRCCFICCCNVLCRCRRITRTPEEAGGHMFNIATGVPPYHDKSGLYFYDGQAKQPSEEASQPVNEDRLWEWSEAMTV